MSRWFKIQHLKSQIQSAIPKRLGMIAVIFGLGCFFLLYNYQMRSHYDPSFAVKQPPLVMQGGDPYIRALMRTISASEANQDRPYSLLYGGQHFSDFSHHPEMCVRIVNGPNKNNCSTAAGRYQLINTTWSELAPRYHPQPKWMMLWTAYSFEPEYQDKVVYAWLSDPQAWGVDISQLLHQGKISQVLKRLSGTWTSLGYGIETNSVSGRLPKIYQKMLQEELAMVRSGN